jgi:hypothetical protein
MRRTYRRSQPPRAGAGLWFAPGSAITNGETSHHIGCPAGEPLAASVLEGLAGTGLGRSVRLAMRRALIATFCLAAGVRPS